MKNNTQPNTNLAECFKDLMELLSKMQRLGIRLKIEQSANMYRNSTPHIETTLTMIDDETLHEATAMSFIQKDEDDLFLVDVDQGYGHEIALMNHYFYGDNENRLNMTLRELVKFDSDLIKFLDDYYIGFDEFEEREGI